MRLLVIVLLNTSCVTLSSTVGDYFEGTTVDGNSMRPFKEFVTNNMIDPDSVRFRKLRFFYPVNDGRRITVLCGQVNAKNLMGGYAGFSNFATNGVSSVVDSDVEWVAVPSRIIIDCLCVSGEIPARCR